MTQYLNIPEEEMIVWGLAGSRLYNLHREATADSPGSDYDYRGIKRDRMEDIMDITGDKNQEIRDPNNDALIYSLKKFLRLAAGCNPSVMELLWLPEDAIIYKSPIYDLLVANRDLFITKRAKDTYMGYARGQIERAKGLGKKGNSIKKYVDPLGLRVAKTFMEFKDEQFEGFLRTYDFDWLQRTYGSNFIKYVEKVDIEPLKTYNAEALDALLYMEPPKFGSFVKRIGTTELGMPFRPIPFTGNPNKFDISRVEGCVNVYRAYRNGTGFLADDCKQVVCHSITEDREIDDFAFLLQIDIEGYSKAKAEYDSFWEWMVNRNESRYTQDWQSETLTDCKNLMHTMRLIFSAYSIAQYGHPIIRFTNGLRERLMAIRNGEIPYDDIREDAKTQMRDIEALFNKSKLPDHCDVKKVNALYKECMELCP